MAINKQQNQSNKDFSNSYPTKTLDKIKTLVSTISNWYLVFPDKLGLVKTNLVYKIKNGDTVICRPKSPDINETVIIYSDYEYPKKYLNVNDGDVIFDLGANIGLFSLYFSSVNKEIDFKGYSFEPFIENFNILKKNLAANNIHKFEVIQSAVSDVDGHLYIDTTLPPDAISASKDEVGEKIPSTKISTFAKNKGIKNVKLLKMDIEGGEYPIFKNDYTFIRENVESIIMEYHELDNEKNYKALEAIIAPDFDIEKIYQVGHGGVFYAKNKKIKTK